MESLPNYSYNITVFEGISFGTFSIPINAVNFEWGGGGLDLFPNKEQVHIFWSLYADA